MTTSLTHQTPGARLARTALLCLLALAAVLWQSAEARAQWVTSGTTTSTTNNVGIGTNTPAQMFHVHGPSSWAGTRVTTAGTGPTWSDGINFGYDDTIGGMVWNREATPIVFATNNAERMRLDAAGNLGIGTASPAQALHVKGKGLIQNTGLAGSLIMDRTDGKIAAFGAGGVSATFAYDDTGVFKIESNTRANIATGTFGDGAATRLIIDGTGNVGVGTASPGSIFEVFKDQPYGGSVATMTQVRVNNPNASGFSTFSVWGNGAERGRLQYNAGLPNIFVTSQGAIPLHLGTNDTVRLTVDGTSGNVGVGTSAPASKLHVAGDIRVDGNINAKYQDVAEWVPSTQKLAAGTVVILDIERDNHVAASASSYDTRVAGVISAQPGISLGEAGEGKVLVATTGRVKVKVDATHGPIKVGDLLVTSGVPGVAMKSQPLDLGGVPIHRPGTLIGKALESLTKGTGEILVLLSLQ